MKQHYLLTSLTLVAAFTASASWDLERAWELVPSDEVVNDPVDVAEFTTQNSNLASWGAVAFHGGRAYVLGTNNGIMALDIVGEGENATMEKVWELNPGQNGNEPLDVGEFSAQNAGEWGAVAFHGNRVYVAGANNGVLAFEIIGEGLDRQLDLLWELSADDESIAFLNDSGNRQRGLTVNPVTGNLLLVNRIANNNIQIPILDGDTGAMIGNLSVSGIQDGSFHLNLIAAAEDGAIYACNWTSNSASTAFKIYRWANEQANPTVAYMGDPSQGNSDSNLRRWGITFAARGSGTNTELISTTRGNLAAVFTTSNGSDFSSTRIVVNDPLLASGHPMEKGVTFYEGNRFLAKTTGGPLLEIEYNLATGTGVLVRSFSDDFGLIPGEGAPIGYDPASGLLGMILEAGNNQPRYFHLYQYDALNDEVTVDFLTDSGNDQRGMTVNPVTGNVLLVNRIANNEIEIVILDGDTGEKTGELSVAGIMDGTWYLNLIAAADDGVIYAANWTTNSAANAFKIYRWENEEANPTVAYMGDPSQGDPVGDHRRWGFTFAARGAGANTELVSTTGGTLAAVFTTGNGTDFSANRVSIDEPLLAEGRLMERGVTFHEGNRFLAKSNGSGSGDRPLLKIEYDLTTGTGQLIRSFSSDAGLIPEDGGPIGYDPASGFLGMLLRAGNDQPHYFHLYYYDSLESEAAVDFLTDSGNRQRGLAVNPVTGNVLVVHRVTDSIIDIPVLNRHTGARINTLSVENVEGGSFALSEIAVADDGVIYAANYVTNSANTDFRIYRWQDENADPQLVYSGDPSGNDSVSSNRQNWGETMGIRGAGNSTELIFSSRGTLAAVFTTNDGGANFTANRVYTDADAGELSREVAFVEGNRFLAKTATGSQGRLLEIEYDLTEESGTIVRAIGTEFFPQDIGPIAVDLERGLLAGVLRGGGGATKSVMLYDYNTLSTDTVNQPLAVVDFTLTIASAGGWGKVVFDQDQVFALSTNNGILALNLVEAEAAITFAAWRDFHFTEAELADETISGADVDLVGDGLTNFLRYAFGLGPRDSGLHRLPALEKENGGLQFTFYRVVGAADLSYVPQYSLDLQTWDTDAQILEEIDVIQNGETEIVIVEVHASDEDRIFVRLAVNPVSP